METEIAEGYGLVVGGTIAGSGLCPAVQPKGND